MRLPKTRIFNGKRYKAIGALFDTRKSANDWAEHYRDEHYIRIVKVVRAPFNAYEKARNPKPRAYYHVYSRGK